MTIKSSSSLCSRRVTWSFKLVPEFGRSSLSQPLTNQRIPASTPINVVVIPAAKPAHSRAVITLYCLYQMLYLKAIKLLIEVQQKRLKMPSKCHQMNLKDLLHIRLPNKQMRCVRMSWLRLMSCYSSLPPSSGMLKNSEFKSWLVRKLQWIWWSWLEKPRYFLHL